jgi:hypothetical protein
MPNLAQLSTGTKVLLGAGLLLFIDLFLDWQQVCVNLGPLGNQCGSRSGWHGIGVLVGLLVIALLVWEVVQVFNLLANVQLPVAASLISVVLAAAIVLFGVIEFFTHNEARHWPAWVGLILLVVIAIGGWLKFSEPETMPATAGAPPAAPPPAAPPA